MRLPWRSITLTVVLALLAAGVGTWLGAHYFVPKHGGGFSLHQMVHKDLRLTSDQEQRLTAIERDFAFKRQALEAEIHAANRQLAQAIQESQQDSPAVQAAVDRLHGAMGALQKVTVAHVFEMRAVLTPEQAKKFDSEVAAALTDEDR